MSTRPSSSSASNTLDPKALSPPVRAGLVLPATRSMSGIGPSPCGSVVVVAICSSMVDGGASLVVVVAAAPSASARGSPLLEKTRAAQTREPTTAAAPHARRRSGRAMASRVSGTGHAATHTSTCAHTGQRRNAPHHVRMCPPSVSVRMVSAWSVAGLSAWRDEPCQGPASPLAQVADSTRWPSDPGCTLALLQAYHVPAGTPLWLRERTFVDTTGTIDVAS